MTDFELNEKRPGFARISAQVPAPVLPKEHAKEPKIFTHRVTLEYRTINSHASSFDIAKAILSALSDADDSWVSGTRLLACYSVEQGRSRADINPPISKSEAASA